MLELHTTLNTLMTDIADAIREKTGSMDAIQADTFPDMIADRLSQSKPTCDACLTFSSDSAFTVSVNNKTINWNGILQYSTDKKQWMTWSGATTLESDVRGDENVLYFRGIRNATISDTTIESRWLITGTNIACSGNIETLLDYATVEAGNHPTMSDYCYSHMFYGCTSLTQAPALPATTLAAFCYLDMFSGCTSLTQAPALPATKLTVYCYSSMFQGCTSLTQAPSLPATKLVDNCYANMFGDCTALTKAPSLPATTLARNCYYHMFLNCTRLTQAPILPVTTLAEGCYYRMFSGCSSLTQAPALPATTLANSCYSYMFTGCTALTKAPALPATKLTINCYQGMFLNCSSLTQAPALPATTLENHCYNSMFQGCKKIKVSSTQAGEYTVAYRIPTTGTGTTAANSLYNMFSFTGGTYKGTPSINTTYYLSNTNTVV